MKIYIVIDNYSEDAKSSPHIVGAFDSEDKAKEAMASGVGTTTWLKRLRRNCDGRYEIYQV